MIWRVVKLVVGLVLFGTGIWVGLKTHLGVGPWDVLSGGLSQQLGIPFGTMAVGVSIAVMGVGLAVGVRPGIGTLLNVILVGLVIDVLLATPLLDGLQHEHIALRLGGTVGGILLIAVGSALYLGAHLGPGPRDGLMVAFVERTGWRVGVCRALLELTVLSLGVALRGPVGIGTIAFALGIGPALQLAFLLLRQTPVRRPVEAAA